MSFMGIWEENISDKGRNKCEALGGGGGNTPGDFKENP